MLGTSALRGWGLCGHFADKRGSSDADVRTLMQKKLRIFRNLLCVRTDKEGWASASIIRTRGEGVNFSRFCKDVLYGRPLTIWCFGMMSWMVT